MPDKEGMAEKSRNICQIEWPDKMPEDMAEKMPQNMPDRNR